MQLQGLTPDSTFPYKLFRFAHKRNLDSVSASYFAVVSKDSHPVGLILTIDIDERWHHARSAATAFWQVFVREFNHSQARSTLVRFEESLKELNKVVVKTQEKVQQPISVSAAVLEGNQIHFSTIGTSRFLLVRSGQFNDVTASSESTGNQFSAVTSGDLDSRDVVIVSNQNIYEFLAAEPDELWLNSELGQLSQQIHEKAQNTQQALNCIILQYDADNPAQTTVYWEESEKSYPIRLPKLSLGNFPRPELKSLPKIKLNLPKVNLQKIQPSLKKFGNFLRSLLTKLPSKRYGLGAGAVILILVVIIISRGLFSSESISEEPTTNATIEGIIQSADRETFISSLATATESGELQSISDDELAQLVAAAQTNKVELITKSAVINELPETIVGIDQLNNSLFAIDQTGQLWQIGSVAKKIDHQLKVSNPSGILAFSAKSLLITDTHGNIWHYQGKKVGPTAMALPTTLSSGQKILGKFANNLYIYGSAQNAIYRQLNFKDEITNSSPYFGLAAINNQSLVDLAVNGNFIVVTSTGKLAGVLRNEITLKEQTLRYFSGSAQLTSPSENLIIVETNRVISGFNANGKQLWTKFFFDAQISDLSSNGQQLTISSDKKIYRVDI